jgi:hypothetical protein
MGLTYSELPEKRFLNQSAGALSRETEMWNFVEEIVQQT